MKSFSYILTLGLIIFLSSCKPSYENFFYSNSNEPEFFFSLIDSGSGNLYMGRTSPKETISCYFYFYNKGHRDYIIQDLTLYIIGRNQIDSIRINTINYNSSNSQFKELPLSERRVSDSTSNYIECEIPQIEFDDYDIYELNFEITIDSGNKIINKKFKQNFNRKKEFYLKSVWL